MAGDLEMECDITYVLCTHSGSATRANMLSSDACHTVILSTVMFFPMNLLNYFVL